VEFPKQSTRTQSDNKVAVIRTSGLIYKDVVSAIHVLVKSGQSIPTPVPYFGSILIERTPREDELLVALERNLIFLNQFYRMSS
jgi:hypothetical protein